MGKIKNKKKPAWNHYLGVVSLKQPNPVKESFLLSLEAWLACNRILWDRSRSNGGVAQTLSSVHVAFLALKRTNSLTPPLRIIFDNWIQNVFAVQLAEIAVRVVKAIRIISIFRFHVERMFFMFWYFRCDPATPGTAATVVVSVTTKLHEIAVPTGTLNDKIWSDMKIVSRNVRIHKLITVHRISLRLNIIMVYRFL